MDGYRKFSSGNYVCRKNYGANFRVDIKSLLRVLNVRDVARVLQMISFPTGMWGWAAYIVSLQTSAKCRPEGINC